MAKKKRQVGRGRWKQSKTRKTIFIKRALSMTLSPQTEIAKRAGVGPRVVSIIARRDRIRPPELTKAIHGSAVSSARKRILFPRRRKKIGHFKTDAEKWAAIKKHNVTIEGEVNKWWKSEWVKQAFGRNKENMLKQAKLFVFQQLDYFDPNERTEKGRPAEIKRWIRIGAEFFCRKIYNNEKEKDTRNRTAIQKLATAKTGPITARSRVPATAKPLLKKLGFDISAVSEVGFGDIRKEIIRIAEEKETGLTERQKQVVRMRLEDQTLAEIAERLDLKAQSGIYAFEDSATKKIKKRLESFRPQQ